MKQWALKFWLNHGTRIIFGMAATAFGVVFYFIPNMQGEAKTILIGVAMLCFNKARGENGKPAEPEKPPEI